MIKHIKTSVGAKVFIVISCMAAIISVFFGLYSFILYRQNSIHSYANTALSIAQSVEAAADAERIRAVSKAG